jgi:hypothetical protein
VVSILKSGLGPQAYNASLAREVHIKTELQEARETAAVCERIVSDQSEASVQSGLEYHTYMESFLVDNDDECSLATIITMAGLFLIYHASFASVYASHKLCIFIVVSCCTCINQCNMDFFFLHIIYPLPMSMSSTNYAWTHCF